MTERKWLVRYVFGVIQYTPDGDVVEVRALDSTVRERLMAPAGVFAATQVEVGQGDRLIVHGVAAAGSHLEALEQARTAIAAALGPQMGIVDTVGAEANLVEEVSG